MNPRLRRWCAAGALLLALAPCVGCIGEARRRQFRLQTTLGEDIDATEVADLLQFAWDRHVLGISLDRSRALREAFVLYLAVLDPERLAIDEAHRLRLIQRAGINPAAYGGAAVEARDVRASAFPSSTPDESTACELALECAFRRLDPHSGFLDREAWAETLRSITGGYSGIGIVIRHAEEPLVLEVFDDGPSAGFLLPGDRILRVDGTDVRGLSSSEYLALVRGREGTPVTLTIRRAGQLTDVNLTRRQVQAKAVRTFAAGPDGEVLVLHLRAYTEGCADEVEAALRRHRRPLRGIILDLRSNPGGTVDDAVAIVDLFIDTGPVIIERGRERKVLEAETGGSAVAREIPLIVAVNRYSASASELTAGALQDHGRAVIVGERTFGKGTVQEIYRMGDRGAKVTVALFYTPSGRSTQRVGVLPDVERPDAILVRWEQESGSDGPSRFERDYDNAIPADTLQTGFVRPRDTGALVGRLRARMDVPGPPDSAADPEDDLLQEMIRALAGEPALRAR